MPSLSPALFFFYHNEFRTGCYIRLDNALHEFIILEEKKVKNFWFWPGFEPAIFRLKGHWGNHYTVAACWIKKQIYKDLLYFEFMLHKWIAIAILLRSQICKFSLLCIFSLWIYKGRMLKSTQMRSSDLEAYRLTSPESGQHQDIFFLYSKWLLRTLITKSLKFEFK